MEKNKIFYQRFARYWDLTHHLTMYDDEMNPKNAKRQEKKMEKAKKEIQKKIQTLFFLMRFLIY